MCESLPAIMGIAVTYHFSDLTQVTIHLQFWSLVGLLRRGVSRWKHLVRQIGHNESFLQDYANRCVGFATNDSGFVSEDYSRHRRE